MKKTKQFLSIYFTALILCFFFLIISCSNPQKEAETHFKNAIQYFKNQEYEKAKIELQNVVQLDPSNDKAYTELGETYVKLQNPVKAAQAFAQAVTIAPDNYNARLRMGQILLLAEETRQAREAASELRKKYPEKVEPLHLLASIQIQERNMAQALKTLKKAVVMDSTDHRTYLYLAHLYYITNRFDQAEKNFLKTIELNNQSRTPYIELAELYKRKKEYDKAEDVLNKWKNIPGEQVQKSKDVASFQESRGHIEKAEKILREASVNAPGNVSALINLGAFYARQKKNDKAIEIFKQAQSIDIDNLDIQANIAALYLIKEKRQEAETIVDQVLSIDEEHEKANFIKGRILYDNKDYTSALKHFESVITSAPNHSRARYLKARCLIDEKPSGLEGQELFRVAAGFKDQESWERKLAKDELLKSVQIAPDFIEARLLIIDLHLKDKELRPARSHIAYILRRKPNNFNAVVFLGKMKIIESNFSDAQKIFNKLLATYPTYAEGYVSLGIAYTGMRQYDKALATFDKALEVDPGHFEALNQKVGIHMLNKNIQKAIEACNTHRKKFETGSPARSVIDLIIAKIYLTTNRTEEARVLFQKITKEHPSLQAPYEELGKIYEDSKDIPSAIGNFKKLKELNPDYLPTYINLSRLYKLEGNLKKAKKILKEALQIQSDFAPAANNLAYIYAQSNSYLYEALKLAKIARDKAPNNPDYLDTLGWIYYLQGSNDLALIELEESVKLNPKSAIGNYHLGWAYYSASKYEQARAHMKKALALDPYFEGAEQAREILGE